MRPLLQVCPKRPELPPRGARYPERMEQRSFQFGGLRFRYLEWGSPASEPIVLLHGFSSTAAAWGRVGESLAVDFHVVAPDLRGHRESDWDTQVRYTDEQLAAGVRALARQLNLATFTLVGHLMVGAVAFTSAGTYPDDVRRLVIEGSAPMPPGRPPAPVRASFASRVEVEQTVRASVTNMPEDVLE